SLAPGKPVFPLAATSSSTACRTDTDGSEMASDYATGLTAASPSPTPKWMRSGAPSPTELPSRSSHNPHPARIGIALRERILQLFIQPIDVAVKVNRSVLAHHDCRVHKQNRHRCGQVHGDVVASFMHRLLDVCQRPALLVTQEPCSKLSRILQVNASVAAGKLRFSKHCDT